MKKTIDEWVNENEARPNCEVCGKHVPYINSERKMYLVTQLDKETQLRIKDVQYCFDCYEKEFGNEDAFCKVVYV